MVRGTASGEVGVRVATQGCGAAAGPGTASPLNLARRRAALVLLVLVTPALLELTVPAPAAAAAGTTAVSAVETAEPDPGRSDPDEVDPDEVDPDEADPEEVARLAAEAKARDQLRDAERQVTRARTALRDARAASAAAREAGVAADGAVRRAEERLPPAVLARLSVTVELTMSRHELRDLHASRAELRGSLADAEEALASQVLRTFKTGHASELTGPVAILREARDPGELARGLADLRSVTRAGVRAVQEAEADLAALELRIADVRARRDQLEGELSATRAALELAEEAAADARGVATEREAGVVAAMEAAVAAERAYEDAVALRARREAAVSKLEEAGRAEPDPAADAPAARGDRAARSDAGARRGERADGRGDGDEEDAAPGGGTTAQEATPLAVRAKEAAGRRRAYERATRLSPAARRTAEDWVCPFDDARFVNDWAFPRTGARRHEGTDVFGARGTPIVAVAAGTVTVLDPTDGRGDLGGITVTIAQDEARQYYAHLERIEPTLRRGDEVEAGDRIGWVGTSGNARGTPPHLHLGWYVEDVAVNPYASLAVACAGRTAPLEESDVHPDAVESVPGADDTGVVGPRGRVS